jgi:hypothetical protein
VGVCPHSHRYLLCPAGPVPRAPAPPRPADLYEPAEGGEPAHELAASRAGVKKKKRRLQPLPGSSRPQCGRGSAHPNGARSIPTAQLNPPSTMWTAASSFAAVLYRSHQRTVHQPTKTGSSRRRHNRTPRLHLRAGLPPAHIRDVIRLPSHHPAGPKTRRYSSKTVSRNTCQPRIARSPRASRTPTKVR